MTVLILGFDNLQEINDIMEKLISESQCFLFSIAAGGLRSAYTENLVAVTWAKNNGAPLNRIIEDTPEALIKKMIKECDYLVMKINDSSPQWHKNLMMAFKKEGKHGTVVR